MITKTMASMQWRLWLRMLKAQKSSAVQAFFLMVYALGIAACCAVVLNTGGSSLGLVLVSATGVLVYWLFHYTTPAPEHQIDVDKLVSLPLTPRQIRPAMVLIEILQSRGLAAIGCTVITAIGGSFFLAQQGHGMIIPVYLLGILVSWTTTMFGVTAIRTIASSGSERSRTVRSILGVLVFAAVYFGFIGGADFSRLQVLGTVLEWLPFAAAIGPAHYLVEGNVPLAIAVGVLALAYMVIAWKLIEVGLRRELAEIPVRSKNQTTGKSSQLLLGNLAPTPLNATFSRAMRYLVRDSRLISGYVVFAAMILGFFVVGVLSNPVMLWSTGYLVLLLPTFGANNFGYNGPGNWTVMVTPTKPSTQLKAETLVHGVTALPFVLAYIVALGAVRGFGLPWASASIIVVCGAVCAVALSMLLSAYNPFPTSRPGTPMMRDRSSQSSSAFIMGLVGIFGFLPLLGPGLIMMIYGLNHNIGVWYGGVAVSVAIALGFYLFGSKIAAKRVDEKMPEIFAKVRTWI